MRSDWEQSGAGTARVAESSNGLRGVDYTLKRLGTIPEGVAGMESAKFGITGGELVLSKALAEVGQSPALVPGDGWHAIGAELNRQPHIPRVGQVPLIPAVRHEDKR